MANINDVINELKTKYNITDSTTEQELLELLNVVTVDEINAIKATSVIPLPNVVKGSPQELKERFVKIVSDEQRGMAKVINDRMGLLRIFLAAYMALETQRLGEKVNYTDILDVLNSEATDKALSANMGRYLKNLIDTLTVDTSMLVDSAVTELKLANGAVGEAKIKTGAITTDKIADDAITNDKVKVNAIHTRNIKNGDITFDKLAQEVINYIDGIASGNSIFRGHFESVDDLPAYSEEIQLHNNDYAYVTIEVEDEETHVVNPELARYKYSEGEWVFEYIIPNTSFSASEWEAIKSGITSTLVSKLMGIETGAQVNVQPDWTQSDNTQDDYIKNKPDNLMTTNTAQDITADKTFSGAKIKFKNSAIDIWDIRKNGSTLEINKDDVVMMQLLSNIIKSKTLVALSDDASLGNSGNKWKDIWFSGSLKDGTNELSLSQIIGKLDKTSTANSLYANGIDGQIMVGFGMGANGGKIPQRDSNGQINVPTTPTNNEHATAKVYVDNLNKDLKEKTLYHLGAYDSIASETNTTVTITRGTGYVSSKDNYISGTTGGGRTYYAFYQVFADKTNSLAMKNNLGYENINAVSWWDTALDTSKGYVTCSSVDGQVVVLPPTSVTSLPSNIEIQFALKSSEQYTDTYFKDRPLNTLDSNMSNKIRQKVVDGLNLFDFTIGYPQGINFDTGNSIDTTEHWRTPNINVKPNTTYTVSSSVSNLYVNVFYYSSSAYISHLPVGWTQYSPFTFTTPSNCASIIIVFRQASIGRNLNYNDLGNPMLVECNHPYPYSSFNQKEHITNPQAELLKGEEEKSSQLFDKNKATTGYYRDTNNNITSSADYFYTDFIEIKPKTTYSISGKTTETARWTLFYNANKQFLGSSYNATEYIFTTPSNAYYAVFSGLQTELNTIMFNKGSSPEPYHEYCGEIVHKKDIENVLLWENGSPNSSAEWTARNITLNESVYHYKYFKIVFRDSALGNNQNYASTFVNRGAAGFTLGLAFVGYRDVSISTSGTVFEVHDAYGVSGNVNNYYIVPIAIYGTNKL